MTHPELFSKNLNRWSVICPNGAEKVKALDCKYINFCKAPTGALNLNYALHGTTHYLHSNNDPIAEANNWFAKLNLRDIQVIFVLGVGLGYCYQAAKEWLKSSPQHSIVFFEENPEVVHRLLETQQGSDLLFDPQVALYLLDIGDKRLQEINTYTTPYATSAFIVSSLYENTLSFSELKTQICFLAQMKGSSVLEYSQHGNVVFKNFFKNYLDLPHAFLGNKLVGKFKEIPAIICGAGPSLNRNIDLLATLHDKALIFGGGSAMNALNAKGIMPHFGIGIDPNAAQLTRLVMNQAYEVPFLYRSRMLYDALEMVHGDRLYVTGSPGYDLSKWMENALGIFEKELDEGFNVLNFSLALAHAMGCNPIITVGVDLAYSQGSSYAEGIISHPIHDRKDHFRTRKLDEELVEKQDIYGNPIYTLWKWVGESMWYGLFAKQNPELKIINATEGGIGFPDVPNYTLSHAAAIYLKNTLDLSALVHEEIQNCNLPTQVTEKRIKELIQTLVESLRACVQKIEKIISIYAKHHAGIPHDTLEKEIADKERNLASESAYQAMLKVFNEHYKTIHGLEFQMIEMQKDLIPQEALEQKKINFEMGRYGSLRLTAAYNASILQHLLNERTNEEAFIEAWKNGKGQEQLKKIKTEHSIPTLQPSEQYSYKEDWLTIQDPELGINFKKQFNPENEGKSQRTYYPNGSLKSEQHYLKNALHGPSTFYAENGSVLAITWFVEGNRQGKKWAYHANGALHSLQRFLNGKEHGRQEYFYDNGMPKSVFSYHQGVMNGEVLLYHRQGQLKRTLTFVMGKREGVERIWDKLGTLRIEAHYHADLPVKTAKQWHSNGTLASEVVYNQESERIETKEWDATGKLIQNKQPADDYFDAATKELTNLTNTLSNILGAVSSLPQKENDKTNMSTAEDLEALNKEMEKLRSIGEQIHSHMEFDAANPVEDLWRNPATKIEMERQLSQVSDQMNKSLKEIQEGFKKILGPPNPPKPS